MGIVLPVFVGTIVFTVVPVIVFMPVHPPPAQSKPTAAISEIDIWRAANMILNWYGQNALTECTKREEEIEAAGDTASAAVWRRIIEALRQLANTTPPGPLH